MMVALLHNLNNLAFHRGDGVIQDRRARAASMEGFATDFITLDCGGLKESEGQDLLAFAQHVQSEATGLLSDAIDAGISLHPDR